MARALMVEELKPPGLTHIFAFLPMSKRIILSVLIAVATALLNEFKDDDESKKDR